MRKMGLGEQHSKTSSVTYFLKSYEPNKIVVQFYTCSLVKK